MPPRRLLLWLPLVLGIASPMRAQDASLPLNSQVKTFGMTGLASGQSAQLNVLNPGLPAPFLAILCTAQLSILGSDGRSLKDLGPVHVPPGKSVSLTLDKDAELQGSDRRIAVRGVVRTPPAGSDAQASPAFCPLVATMEIFDSASGRTELILSISQIVFPVTPVATAQQTCAGCATRR